MAETDPISGLEGLQGYLAEPSNFLVSDDPHGVWGTAHTQCNV